jgi:hypothetical protein
MARPAKPKTKRGGSFRLLSWGLGGLALGVALAFLALNLVARTGPGHEWVLGTTLDALGKGIRGGRLSVERISGNLFEGARLYGLRIVDAEGRTFLHADSADAEYDVRTLLSPRIVVDRLTLYHPEIWAFQLPGDSLWNYQHIFAADTAPRDTTRVQEERLAVFGRVRIVDGRAKVELPFTADSTLPPREQRRMLAASLADTSPVVVRRAAGGYLRTIDLVRLNGVFHDVRFAPGSRTGSRFPIDSLSGDIHFFRRPVQIRQVRGTVALLDDRVEFDAPVMRLPASKLVASGVICMNRRSPQCQRAVPGDQLPYYDVAFRGDTVAFRDLQWLYPRFPGDARGAMRLLVETRPEGTMFLVRDADLRTRRMRARGNFGMIAGDTLRFVDVDLAVSPVDVRAVERMLPDGLPVRGLVLGGVRITGEPATR